MAGAAGQTASRVMLDERWSMVPDETLRLPIASVHTLDQFGGALKADATPGRNGKVILVSRSQCVSARPLPAARAWTTTNRSQSQPLDRMCQQRLCRLKKLPGVRQVCVQFKRSFVGPFGMNSKHKWLPN
jgi:hypothetical protein